MRRANKHFWWLDARSDQTPTLLLCQPIVIPKRRCQIIIITTPLHEMKLIKLISATASLSIAGVVSAGASSSPAAATRPQLSVRTGVRRHRHHLIFHVSSNNTINLFILFCFFSFRLLFVTEILLILMDSNQQSRGKIHNNYPTMLTFDMELTCLREQPTSHPFPDVSGEEPRVDLPPIALLSRHDLIWMSKGWIRLISKLMPQMMIMI